MCTNSLKTTANQANERWLLQTRTKEHKPWQKQLFPLHLRRITPPIKHSQTGLHIPKPIHTCIKRVITFGESRHPGDCSDYNNTSQPAIPMRQKTNFFKLYLIAMAFMALGSWIMCFSRCSLHLLPYFTLVHHSENYSLTVGSLNSPVIRPESVSVIIGAGQHEMRHANDRNNHEQVLKVTPVVCSFTAAHSFFLICR